MGATLDGPCAGETLPEPASTKLDRALALLERTSPNPDVTAARVAKAVARLKKARRIARRAARNGTLSAACADGIAGVVDAVSRGAH